MSTYRGIVLVAGGETYRVQNGEIRKSWGVLDYLNPGMVQLCDRLHLPLATVRVLRNRHIQFGQVFAVDGALVVGLAHPELAP